MTKYLYNTITKIPVQFSKNVCSLLIPKELMKNLNERIQFFGNIATYFDYLISQYRPIYQGEITEEHYYDRIIYQSSDFGLEKINFRPKAGNWYEFGMIAQRWNLSKCYLFVLLLKMDLADLGSILKEKVGLQINSINRHFRKRFFVLKSFFPFRKKPIAGMVYILNQKMKL